MEELKPCPACRRIDIGVKECYEFESRLRVWAYCRNCGYKGPMVLLVDTQSNDEKIRKAYKAWNMDEFCKGV